MYHKIMIRANVTKFGQNFIAPQIFLGWYGYGALYLLAVFDLHTIDLV